MQSYKMNQNLIYNSSAFGKINKSEYKERTEEHNY